MSETERDAIKIAAFIDGAKWWEFTKTGATMWQSDQQMAYQAAVNKYCDLRTLAERKAKEQA